MLLISASKTSCNVTTLSSLSLPIGSLNFISVYGYINPDTEEIEENPIPVENRKKYKYQFLNGQTSCVDDRVKY